MTDHELLQLAAKAAGHNLVFDFDENFAGPCIVEGGWPESWNPLTDDGDALRLAVDLHMLLDCCGLMARTTDDSIPWQEPKGGTDKHALMRRAIVLAAAEIVRAMP